MGLQLDGGDEGLVPEWQAKRSEQSLAEKIAGKKDLFWFELQLNNVKYTWQRGVHFSHSKLNLNLYFLYVKYLGRTLTLGIKSVQPHFSCQDSVLTNQLFSGCQELPCPGALPCAAVISVLLPSLKDVGWAELLHSCTDHFSAYTEWSEQWRGVSCIPNFWLPFLYLIEVIQD